MDLETGKSNFIPGSLKKTPFSCYAGCLLSTWSGGRFIDERLKAFTERISLGFRCGIGNHSNWSR
jgi:hypothetical protein